MNKTTRVFWWSIIVALGGFLFGFDTAVISGVEKSIQQLFGLSPFWHGFTISSALIGTLAGALIAGRPAVDMDDQSLGSSIHWFFAALITFLFPVIAEDAGVGVGPSFVFFLIYDDGAGICCLEIFS